VITKAKTSGKRAPLRQDLSLLHLDFNRGQRIHRQPSAFEQKPHIRVVLKLQTNERKALGKPSQG